MVESDLPTFTLTFADAWTLLCLAESVDDKSPSEQVLVAKLQAYIATVDESDG